MVKIMKRQLGTRIAAAKELLSKLLANGPINAQDIHKQADKQGIGTATLMDAKKILNIVSIYVSAPKGNYRRHNMVQWSLVDTAYKPILKPQIAEEFLREILSDGPIMTSVIRPTAHSRGISHYQLWKTKKDLGIKSIKINGRSCWQLGE